MKPQLIVFAFLAAFLISAHAYNFRLNLLGQPRFRKRGSIFDENKRASNEWNRSGI